MEVKNIIRLKGDRYYEDRYFIEVEHDQFFSDELEIISREDYEKIRDRTYAEGERMYKETECTKDVFTTIMKDNANRLRSQATKILGQATMMEEFTDELCRR